MTTLRKLYDTHGQGYYRYGNEDVYVIKITSYTAMYEGCRFCTFTIDKYGKIRKETADPNWSGDFTSKWLGKEYKKTHTITIDDKTIELSEDSYNALKEQLT